MVECIPDLESSPPHLDAACLSDHTACARTSHTLAQRGRNISPILFHTFFRRGRAEIPARTDTSTSDQRDAVHGKTNPFQHTILARSWDAVNKGNLRDLESFGYWRCFAASTTSKRRKEARLTRSEAREINRNPEVRIASNEASHLRIR